MTSSSEDKNPRPTKAMYNRAGTRKAFHGDGVASPSPPSVDQTDDKEEDRLDVADSTVVNDPDGVRGGAGKSMETGAAPADGNDVDCASETAARGDGGSDTTSRAKPLRSGEVDGGTSPMEVEGFSGGGAADETCTEEKEAAVALARLFGGPGVDKALAGDETSPKESMDALKESVATPKGGAEGFSTEAATAGGRGIEEEEKKESDGGTNTDVDEKAAEDGVGASGDVTDRKRADVGKTLGKEVDSTGGSKLGGIKLSGDESDGVDNNGAIFEEQKTLQAGSAKDGKPNDTTNTIAKAKAATTIKASAKNHGDISTLKRPEQALEATKAETAASFVLRPPVKQSEVAAVAPGIRSGIEEALDTIESEGYEAFKARQNRAKAEEAAELDSAMARQKEEEQKVAQSLNDAVVRGTPRQYQMKLFELAKEWNTIVNLGTGRGKTLVALLLIKHLAAAYDVPIDDTGRTKQTLFLVPSVALASQHTTTLRANLPYTVDTACHATANSNRRRELLAAADIIVATHGAAKDLLMHYGDMFSLDRVNLLVVDECHYATGGHGYAMILNRFYKSLPHDKRPRVLGLTASPLVNVKKNVSDKKLMEMLGELETTLNCRLACLSGLGLDPELASSNESGGTSIKVAEEKVVHYRTTPIPPLSLTDDADYAIADVHPSRIREFRQLDELHAELGPKVMAMYCKTLSREVSRNRYDQETAEQFNLVVRRLEALSEFCGKLCEGCPYGGRTDKLLALESLLEDIIENGGSADTVGVVFVERRITALALYDYFRQRRKAMEDGNGEGWVRAGTVRRTECVDPIKSAKGAHGNKLDKFVRSKRAEDMDMGDLVSAAIDDVVMGAMSVTKEEEDDDDGDDDAVFANADDEEDEEEEEDEGSDDELFDTCEMAVTEHASDDDDGEGIDGSDGMARASAKAGQFVAGQSADPEESAALAKGGMAAIECYSSDHDSDDVRPMETEAGADDGQFRDADEDADNAPKDAAVADVAAELFGKASEKPKNDHPPAIAEVSNAHGRPLGNSGGGKSDMNGMASPNHGEDAVTSASAIATVDNDVAPGAPPQALPGTDQFVDEKEGDSGKLLADGQDASKPTNGKETMVEDAGPAFATSVSLDQFKDAKEDNDEDKLQGKPGIKSEGTLDKRQEGTLKRKGTPLNMAHADGDNPGRRHRTKLNESTIAMAMHANKSQIASLSGVIGDNAAISSKQTGGAPPSVANIKAEQQSIRCDMIVRQTTQVFKYLDKSHKLSTNEQEKAKREDAWLHQMKKIKSVLDGLRRKETNVLIATSVVEEGVDVEACSFVIVFDNLKTTKAYVQMKGRARRKDAKFYVFQNSHPGAKAPVMTLRTAQLIERRVCDFIERREEELPPGVPVAPCVTSRYHGPSVASEIKALEEGEYRAKNGCIDLGSAKSLLNRYTMGIPLDPFSRSSRETMLLHMPMYEGNVLILPAHLPSDVRLVCLPEQYTRSGKKDKQNLLALMACVRLHCLNLLNDRLLPLRKSDMTEKLLRIALKELPTIGPPIAQVLPPSVEKEQKEVFVYPIIQSGQKFDQNDKALRSNGRKLGLITLVPLPDVVPTFKFDHHELGYITTSIGPPRAITLTMEEWNICAECYTCLMNARWRRRTGTMWFRYRAEKASNGVVPPYIVGCLTAEDDLDWARIKQISSDYNRDQKNRNAFVKSLEGGKDMPEARLWAPIYDPNVTYVSYGDSGLTCDAPFPNPSEGIVSYTDYFRRRRGCGLDPKCQLFYAQRLWTLPRKMRRKIVKKGAFDPEYQPSSRRAARDEAEKRNVLQAGEKAPCEGLVSVLLAKDACFETPVADASLFLHCIVLPQILYHMDRVLTAKSFVDHCNKYLPKLGGYLEKILFEDILESLTARSCAMDLNYDRLEWFGDAVLKLIHTDALLHSKDLRQWVAYLHEGDLTDLRSAMGTNARLKNASQSLGIDRFILTAQLGRGQWIPISLELYDKDPMTGATEVVARQYSRPHNKVCADVIESLLGLIYLHHGFHASFEVADELGVTLPRDPDVERPETNVQPKPRLVDLAGNFLGKTDFAHPELIEEAFTHPSAIHEEVPCYQKLEWVGDAALCLAAREWVYLSFPTLDVSELVVIEATLVSNETLAYLGSRFELQKFINHRDHSLPGRLEEFEIDMGPLGRGLWGTDPPKVLSDVVEALLGAAHVDGGVADGQQAALFLLDPVLRALKDSILSSDDATTRMKARGMMHPKQVLHEMGGGILSLRTWREDKFALNEGGSSRCPVWRNNKWCLASLDGNGAVGAVYCCGIRVVSVVENSSHIAKNRACALAVAFLRDCAPELIERLRGVFSTLSKERDEDDDSDNDE